MALLEVNGVSVRYGSIAAVRSVDLSIEEGKICAILGPNGAGKTTILKSIVGLVQPSAGTIVLQGRPLRHLRPHRISRLGVGWVPEGRQIFGTLTVRDNLLIGAFNERRRAAIDGRIEEMYRLFPVLRERATTQASSLSGGQQQMLAIARALMSDPKLLLMDEPSLGLAPTIIRDVFNWIKEINRKGMTILMVEQNARQTFKVADWVYLLAEGSIVRSASPQAMSADSEIGRAYLGLGAVPVDRRGGQEVGKA